jgi:PAS domain S-box-containing protein
VFYVATLVDITERKQMQRVLQESERKYRELVENMAEGLCSIDEKRVVTFMNSKLCQMLGYKPEEVVGKHIYSFFDPENLKILKRELAQRPKGVSSQYEIAWTTKSGKQVPTFMSAIPIFDAQGIHRGSYVTVLDFTERKEEEQRRAQFISMLAHEMRTPLTPILSSGKLLAEQLEPKGEVGSRLAKNILKGAQTLSERLNEFLELSKTEMGLIKVNPQPLKAEGLIERVVEQYLSVFTAKKQKFQVKMGKSLPCVLADEQRTSQVLSNLLSNANKFTPEGGQVTLRAKAEGNALVIEVEDNGPGIPLEQQTTLFQPYTHSDKFPGLGLGLAISKQLVELQGGKIWCHSQSGKGSIFGFSLPLAKETVDSSQ